MKITRVFRVLEYSADSIEAIQNILMYWNDKPNPNPINGILGGGSIISTCDPTSILFSDGKYRLIRYLEYRSGDRFKHDFGLDRDRKFTGLEIIAVNFSKSNIPINGEKIIEQNGYSVLIRSGLIGNGFGENVEVDE